MDVHNMYIASDMSLLLKLFVTITSKNSHSKNVTESKKTWLLCTIINN